MFNVYIFPNTLVFRIIDVWDLSLPFSRENLDVSPMGLEGRKLQIWTVYYTQPVNYLYLESFAHQLFIEQ